MGDHPLDNHLWNALNGSLATYSRAVGDIRLLAPDIGHVAAMKEMSQQNMVTLADALEIGSEIVVIGPDPALATDTFATAHVAPVLQIVAKQLQPAATEISTQILSPADFPAMLELVTLAKPGPLAPRAMELGRFRGIYDGDRLVALCGERMHLKGYTEVATVCTHPDYRGRNYAKAVVSAVAIDIVKAGNTPFLGVNADNLPAIALYRGLGFAERATFYVSVLKRVQAG